VTSVIVLVLLAETAGITGVPPAPAPPPEPMPLTAPPLRPFRRTGRGLLLELAAGSAVALPTAYLFEHYPSSLKVQDIGGAFIAIGLITAMMAGAGSAVALTGPAVDGPRESGLGPSLGLGLGALAGLVAGASLADSVAGSSSSPWQTYAVFLAVPLGCVVGYNLAGDADAGLPGASTRARRKLALSGLLGGDTLGGAGWEVGYQLDDRVGVGMQAISGEYGGAEGSLRLQYAALAGPRSALLVAAGPHLTAGAAPASVNTGAEKPAASFGGIAAVGWEIRGASGLTFGIELSTVYEPRARNVAQTAAGPIYPGGAVRLGFAR
jgi:hypothetical protein